MSGKSENTQINSVVGGVAERLKAPVLKTGGGVSRPWVRIPPPPSHDAQRQIQGHFDREVNQSYGGPSQTNPLTLFLPRLGSP